MNWPTEAWDTHRAVLAAGLDASSWDAVATGASTLKRLDPNAGDELTRCAVAPTTPTTDATKES